MSQLSSKTDGIKAKTKIAAGKSMIYEGRTYILASSLLAEHRARVLKHNETFAVFDRYGEIYSAQDGEEGLYHKGTRHLSQSEFMFGEVRPLLLNSTITNENLQLTIDLANPDFVDLNGKSLSRGGVHVHKSSFLYNSCCYERITVTNYTRSSVSLPLTFEFDADFKDIFEIRGTTRVQRGEIREARWENGDLVLAYLGRDGIERRTRISYATDEPHPSRQEGRSLYFTLALKSAPVEIYLCHDLSASDEPESPLTEDAKQRFDRAFARLTAEYQGELANDVHISTPSEQFNDWVMRSHSDLRMMITRTPLGPYPYAGVPWFSAPFGRDGIITALQTLWFNAGISRGVLAFLATTQARELAAERDAEPGKILHEFRHGEMANLNEIPFARYYGSVDSTPLFIVLAGEYLKATGELDFIRSIWENILAALRWIDEYGDADKDGFVEYSRRSSRGLRSQGWKDSHDSIFHRDGSDAMPPVALCEVQGYVYQAKTNASLMARTIGDLALSERLALEAEQLKKKFNESFWCEEIGTLALALDGDKKQCRVRSSNPGHCLYSGIVAKERAPAVIKALMDSSSFCGWGLRTISGYEARYNPMSYHNGSVWPHDTSIVAMGMTRYGYKDLACQLLRGLFEVSRSMDLNRLPELFCGFSMRSSQGPTHYPLSCAPQAWAAGSVFLMLQACLGLSLEADSRSIVFSAPELPHNLNNIRLTGLRVGRFGSADVEVIRYSKDIGVHVLRRDGEVTILTTK